MVNPYRPIVNVWKNFIQNGHDFGSSTSGGVVGTADMTDSSTVLDAIGSLSRLDFSVITDLLCSWSMPVDG